MKAKKTFPVDMLKNQVNSMLERSTCSAAERQAAISVLTNVLHATGNYKGFMWLEKLDAPDFDSSRRRYF